MYIPTVENLKMRRIPYFLLCSNFFDLKRGTVSYTITLIIICVNIICGLKNRENVKIGQKCGKNGRC